MACKIPGICVGHWTIRIFPRSTRITWLIEHWEPEELQHGRALKAYIHHVWPEFDWDGAYADFFSEYAKLCTAEQLEPTRGQEMVARCIVEMGTTTYYQALNTVCGEPVLRELTWHIRNDEVQHYKHFYHYFLPSCATSDRRTFTDRRSSQPCGAGLLNCVTAMPISPCATRRHGASGAHSSSAGSRGHEAGLCTHGAQYPVELGVRMALKPLQLHARVQRWAERPLAALARRALLN